MKQREKYARPETQRECLCNGGKKGNRKKGNTADKTPGNGGEEGGYTTVGWHEKTRPKSPRPKTERKPPTRQDKNRGGKGSAGGVQGIQSKTKLQSWGGSADERKVDD